GERRLPLVVNHVHRYFWYVAVLFAALLTYDAVISFKEADGGHVGLGSLILVANAALIWLYTLSCHSCRHVVGGRLRHFSKHPLRYQAWTFVSKLNSRHAQYAWLSPFSVAIADLYVLLLSTGAITHVRLF